jgi:iron complex outermembrane receptor protein
LNHHRTAAAAATLAGLLAAAAPPDAQAAAGDPANTVVVTGNALGSDALAQPSSVLTGDALAQRRAGTLGETLDGLAGVSATRYGPQASRPVIRGLDGDRIRLLDNGGASADASNLSFDHAVAIDPLVIDRVEVLRGPAALLYGGNATGGVVNTLDNRIPRAPVDGLGGRAELRLGGAASERAAAAVLEGGSAATAGGSGLNWHVDAADHRSDDLRTPLFTPLRDGQPDAPTRRVLNSGGHIQSAAVGASLADADGFAGLALDGYRNDYGTTVEPDVTIRMRREHLAAAFERRRLAGPLGAWFSQVEGQASVTRYQHQEVDGNGSVATTFKSLGQNLRLQARHQPVALGSGAQLQGVVGLQAERLDFSALGDEAFVPATHSRSDALFVQEALQWHGATLSAGLRSEKAQVQSDGDPADSTSPRFGGPQTRQFAPRSISLGLVLPLDASAAATGAGPGHGWQFSASVGDTQRAPAYYELFANGLHAATGTVEVGDPSLGLERSRHLEAGLAWQGDGRSVKAQLWRTRFASYIGLDTQGDTRDIGGSAVPVYRFTSVPATLHGAELEARQRWRSGSGDSAWAWEASAALDLVHGRNNATGEPLPRLAPQRTTLGLQAAQGGWRWGAQWRRLAAQNDVPANDAPTPGAHLVDLWTSWDTRGPAGSSAVWTLRLANAGNALAYNAATLPTARWLAPAGARALSGTLRLAF